MVRHTGTFSVRENRHKYYSSFINDKLSQCIHDYSFAYITQYIYIAFHTHNYAQNTLNHFPAIVMSHD